MSYVRALLCAVILAGMLVASPPLASPADAATVDIPVHEFNLCGARCNGGSHAPANVVAFAVTGGRPWSVSLSEVCINATQYGTMVNALDDIGYSPEVYVAHPNAGNCSGLAYGNVAFAIGNRVGSGVSRYSFPSQDGGTEIRGVVCAQRTGFFGDWQACSTHLDNARSVALDQEGELYNVAALSGCKLSIYGGDFNIEPEFSDLNKWRSAYDEIDELYPYVGTIKGATPGELPYKIDFIWIRDCGAMSSPYPVGSDVIDVSDHHYYSGRFRLTY